MGTVTCRVCRNEERNATFRTREMMFGTREEFDYFECARCGCVQIAEIPPNMESYYPPGYYSLDGEIARNPGRLAIFLKRQLTSHYGGRFNPLGMILARAYRNDHPWLKAEFVGFRHRILDVGCGSGRMLNLLHSCGFRDLVGVDPFIARDIHYQNGITVLKGHLADIQGRFDVVMFQQSFEHVPDPLVTLAEARRKLSPGGYVMICTPVTSSLAWRKYGADWVQLDPPRHLVVHSIRSMELLAHAVGLRVEEVLYCSTEFQFVGSEAYRRDVSLVDYYAGRKLFTPRQQRQFAREAQRLDRINDGDTAAFYLRGQLG